MSHLTYKGMLLASWRTHWIAVVTISSPKKDIEEYHAVMQICNWVVLWVTRGSLGSRHGEAVQANSLIHEVTTIMELKLALCYVVLGPLFNSPLIPLL